MPSRVQAAGSAGPCIDAFIRSCVGQRSTCQRDGCDSTIVANDSPGPRRLPGRPTVCPFHLEATGASNLATASDSCVPMTCRSVVQATQTELGAANTPQACCRGNEHGGSQEPFAKSGPGRAPPSIRRCPRSTQRSIADFEDQRAGLAPDDTHAVLWVPSWYRQEKSTWRRRQVLDSTTEFGRRDWTRTNDPHHVKVVL